jgi:hypothetical protein
MLKADLILRTEKKGTGSNCSRPKRFPKDLFFLTGGTSGGNILAYSFDIFVFFSLSGQHNQTHLVGIVKHIVFVSHVLEKLSLRTKKINC